MRRIVFLVLCYLIAGCVAPQPDSAKTVAAFEVPLRSKADRGQFVSILRAAAKAEGMHVDVESEEDIAYETKVNSNFAKTINLAVWRGANDDECVASAMDFPDNLGQVWIMFSKGEDPKLVSRFRDSAMHQILLHWPDTLSLPVLPDGVIPLHRDLIKTPTGYKVDPSQSQKYGLKEPEKQPH